METTQGCTFPEGFIGFPELQGWTASKEDGLACLRSTDDPLVCFFVANPKDYFPDYSPSIDPSDVEAIEAHPDSFSIGVILCIGKNRVTANLKAPIIMNEVRGIGRQVILTSKKYNTRHVIETI